MTLNIGGAEVRITASVSGQQQVDQLSASLGKLGQAGEASARQMAFAFKMLPAQFTDIATQLAGGQNPFLILIQQGGQIKDMFGGFGNMFRGLAAFLTPARAAIGGMAVGVGVLAKAFYDGKQEISEFNRILALTGNSAGFTLDKYQGLSEAIAKSSRQTLGGSKEIVSALLGTGAFSGDTIAPVAEAITRLKDLTGQSAEELSKQFGGAIRDVSGLASQLSKQIGYLTADQYRYIQSLEAQGKFDEAMIYNAELLNKELAKRKPELNALESAWDAVKKKASEAWDSMAGSGRGQTLTQQIDELQRKLDHLNAQPQSMKNVRENVEAQLSAAKEQLRVLTEQAESAGKVADAQKKAVGRVPTEDRLTVEVLQRHALAYKDAADAVISEVQREQFEISAARSRNLISEEEYLRRTAENRKREIDAEIALANSKKTLTAQEPVKDEVAVAARERRIQEIELQIAALERKKTSVSAESAQEAETAAFLQSRAVRNYSQDLLFQNKLIELQGREVSMTAFEYQKLVKEKQFEQELAQKTRDMAPGEAAAYKSVAQSILAQRQELEKANYEKSRTAGFGAQSFFRSYAEDASNMAKQTQEVLSNAFKKTEDALVDFVSTGKLSFKDLADSIIKDIARMAIRSTILQPLANMMSGLLGGGVTAAAPGIAPGLGGLGANGGAFVNGVQAFASGGIVTRPTLFPMARGAGLMGEAGPEAIMPLRRGADGKLGVSSSPTVVNVNVNDQNNSKVSVQQSQGADGSMNIDVLVEAAVARSIAKNGGVAQALQNRYGLNRAGGR